MLLRIVFLILPFYCIFISAVQYKAAVFNQYPSIESTPTQTIEKNVNNYREKIQQAQTKGVNIIVFPEYGLTGLVDDPTEYALFLNESYPYKNLILVALSDTAVAHEMIIVVNLLEKEEVSNKTYYYNTNIVFSKQGDIIAKYRKINLSAKEKKYLTAGTNLTTFQALDTTFGLITGIDALYTNPGREIATKASEILMPVAQVSVLPYFISTSFQHSYAIANKVNLLAASYVDPQIGYSGGGIYTASGITQHNVYGGKTKDLLFTDLTNVDQGLANLACAIKPTSKSVFTTIGSPDLSNFITEKSFNYNNYKFQDIDLTKTKTTIPKLCHKDVCCTFHLTLNPPVSDTNQQYYRAAAYDGDENYFGSTKHVQICSLLVCNADKSTCGDRINSTTVFTNITIIAEFPKQSNLIFPSSLNYYLSPVTESRLCNITIPSDKKTRHVLSVDIPVENLVSFSVLGLDGVSAGIQSVPSLCILFAGVFIAMFKTYFN